MPWSAPDGCLVLVRGAGSEIFGVAGLAIGTSWVVGSARFRAMSHGPTSHGGGKWLIWRGYPGPVVRLPI